MIVLATWLASTFRHIWTFRALTVMKLRVEHWDALAVEIIQTKLPPATQQGGISLVTKDIPTLKELLTFIEKRAHTLPTPSDRNASQNYNAHRRTSTSLPQSSNRLTKSNLDAAAPGNCVFCNQSGHHIARCPQLIALSVADRFAKIKGLNLCFNCLKAGHASKQCSGGNYRGCGGRDHTFLCRCYTSRTDVSGRTTYDLASAATQRLTDRFIC